MSIIIKSASRNKIDWNQRPMAVDCCRLFAFFNTDFNGMGLWVAFIWRRNIVHAWTLKLHCLLSALWVMLISLWMSLKKTEHGSHSTQFDSQCSSLFKIWSWLSCCAGRWVDYNLKTKDFTKVLVCSIFLPLACYSVVFSSASCFFVVPVVCISSSTAEMYCNNACPVWWMAGPSH